MTVRDEVIPTRVELSGTQRARLEERLQRAKLATARSAEPRSVIPRRPAQGEIPLSYAQERLWFLDQLEPGSAVYNVCQALRLQGVLDLAVLERALNEIVRRHEVLRTNVITVEGRAVQVVAPSRNLPVSFVDLTAESPDDREAELQRRLQAESRRPFDFSRDLLLRVMVVRSADREHTLLLTMHHIISDGWSLGILFREMAALYTAYRTNQPAALPELPLQFADYALWEREHLKGPALEGPLAYWKKQLADPLPVLELPVDRPRGAGVSTAGGVHTVQLSPELTQALKGLAQQEGATLFMALLAAFQVLLHRWTGQEDIVVGSVVAGRRRVELERLIGFFVNTVVIRADLGGEPGFRQLLARVRETALGAMAHQDAPFECLVRELRPDRNAGRNPLFQVMFVLQNAPMAPADLPELRIEPVDLDTGTAKFDLTLTMMEGPQGLRASFEYSADLFESATMARLMRCFQTLLEGIVAQPELPVSQLPLLTAAEREQIVVHWNQTARPFPRDCTLPELFAVQVVRAGQAVAVIQGDRQLTYAELDARANQVAHRLRRAGVRPETLVALCLERSMELIVAVLGILKAGGTYVSLDPAYPPERLAFMLGDTGAPVVLTQAKLRATVEEFCTVAFRNAGSNASRSAPEIIQLDADWDAIGRESPLAPECGATPENLAYVSYTSGSTGRPKGVCIPHRAVSRLLFNPGYITLGPDDGVLQIANCAFDASTFEIWGALLHGGRLVVVPPEVVLAPQDLAREIADRGITAMFVTTALFNQLSQHAPGIFRGVRHVLFGGEAANPNCVRDVLQQGPPARLLNAYGPTETTTFATWFEVREVPPGAQNVPIGRPISNTTVYVLDPRGQPVPVGVPGELYIGGEGLARGYWNRPELTAERFVPDPFGGSPDGRLYRTGDRVRWLPDGTIEFLGRIDRQVKIRGFRVEPAEVEAVLAAHPLVKECAVVVRDDPSGAKCLVAYVVSTEAVAPGAGTWRTYLEQNLPAHLVPSAFVPLEALPLNANGKVDTRALPDFDGRRPDLDAGHVAPRNEIERELVAIWQQVLGVPRVGVQDRFFDLGGHSLLAVRLVAQLEKKFGRKLPVAAIFQHRTVEQLARLLRAEEPRYASGSSIVDIQGQGTRPPLYLVHGVGGGMFWGYSNLARHLGSDQPILAFKSRGLDGEPEWPSIEELAASYVADLRRHQPHGPYQLGGYCFGGVVAYEMARQLHAAGEEVGLLALMNCSPPNTGYDQTGDRRSLRWQLKFLANLAYWFGCFLFSWSWRERTEFVRWKFRILRRKAGLGQIEREIATTDVDELVNLAAYSDRQRALWQTHVRALMNYRPPAYAGQVTLFRTRGHTLFCSFDPQYGWGRLAEGGVDVRIMPGGHGNILDEPHVRMVAQTLRAILPGSRPKPGAST